MRPSKTKNMKSIFSKKATLFVIATALFSTVVFIVGGALKNFIMFAPALAALLATGVTDRNWKAFGWRFSGKYALLGWLLPIVYAGLAYALIWVLGIGDVPNPLFLERAQLTLGIESDSTPAIIALAFLYISLFMLIPAAVFALGEELGWRGLLFPELNKSTSFIKAASVSSLIWGVWHLPGMLFDGYGEGATPFAFRYAMFLLLILFTGITMAWLWSKSGSIWAVAIFHASHNVVIQMFFDRITLDKEYTEYFKGEFGLALVVTSFLLMVWVLVRSRALTAKLA
jgi:membrane protease YdiL (CAAX protease family)